MTDELEELLGAYWDCAYQEGHLHRIDGNKANKILHDIREAIEQYRKDAACWQFARKELSWSRAWFEQIKWAMYIEMDAPNITAERVTDDSVARELDAAVLAAIAANGGNT